MNRSDIATQYDDLFFDDVANSLLLPDPVAGLLEMKINSFVKDFSLPKFLQTCDSKNATPCFHVSFGWITATEDPRSSEQTWGFNAMRTSRWKNEISFLVPMPKAQGQRALLQASLALPLEGLRVPDGSRNVEIKPKELARQLAVATKAEVIQVIGRTATFYRHNPDLKRKDGKQPWQ